MSNYDVTKAYLVLIGFQAPFCEVISYASALLRQKTVIIVRYSEKQRIQHVRSETIICQIK
jgi:hypothetical protein